MIAALQMYDWSEVQHLTDAFWSRVRKNLVNAGLNAPARLSRFDDIHAPWPDPSLLLGQTCGLPYVMGLAGEAQVIGRPCYGLPMASGGAYCSAVICRSDGAADLPGFKGARAAVNSYVSQSGCHALAAEVLATGLPTDEPFFNKVKITGSHRASAIAVADGTADVAAIDAVAWALFQEIEPDQALRLHVVQWTPKTPGLPLITSKDNAPHARMILSAIQNAASQTTDHETGVPRAVLPADDQDYDAIREIAAFVRGMRLAPDAQVLGHTLPMV
ncbi:MAG: PhnD/SsuA/transferrin family substrate-binding protein [Pseudomonadota bacterium]